VTDWPKEEIPEHTPNTTTPDRSHTDVRGAKTTEVPVKLLDIFEWQITLEEG